MQIQAQIPFNLIIPYIHVSQKLKSNPIKTAIRTVAKPVVQSPWSLLMSDWLLATSPSTHRFLIWPKPVQIPDNSFFSPRQLVWSHEWMCLCNWAKSFVDSFPVCHHQSQTALTTDLTVGLTHFCSRPKHIFKTATFFWSLSGKKYRI